MECDVEKSDGITLPDGWVMKGLNDGESYKYLGIRQAEQIRHMEMKQEISTKYTRRVCKVLEPNLNAGINQRNKYMASTSSLELFIILILK